MNLNPLLGVSSLRIAILLSTLCCGFGASAGLVFSPSLFYKQYTDEFSSTNKTETTETFYDVKLGYALDSGLYFGGIYSGMTRKINETEFIRSSYGASVGYVSNGWFLIGHYLLMTEYKLESNITYTGGDGFQFDLGYWFQIANQFYIGPQITYRSWNYPELKIESSTLDVSGVKGSELLPFISLALLF